MMTVFLYTSRAYQHTGEHEECMRMAEGVIEWLENSPVLTRAMLAVTRHGQMHIFDIKANVDAIGGNKLSCLLALDAADEQFIDALRGVEGESEVCRSQLSHQKNIAP